MANSRFPSPLLLAVRRTVRSIPETVKSTHRAVDTRTLAGAFALAGVLPLAGTRLVLNAPGSVPLVATGSWQALVEATSLVGPAVAAVILGLVDDDAATQVALVAIGTFGLLAVPFPTARVPAFGVVIAGSWLVVFVRLHERERLETVPMAGVVGGALLAGLTIVLSETAGLLPSVYRPIGSMLTLLGVASVPAIVDASRAEWAVGGVIAIVVLFVGTTAPFVTGAVVLIVGGVVGAPLILVALAIGGATSTVVAGLRNERRVAAAGGLLLAAGVPATLPRAFTVIVAVALLLDGTTIRETGGEPA